MKIDELAGIPGLSEALLGPDPSGCDVEVEENGDDVIYLAIDRETDEEVGKLEIENWVIRSLEVDADKAGEIATLLLRRACAEADKETRIIIVPCERKVAGVRAKRFMERFGFLTVADDMMERKPGAALPYSVLL